jgi:ribosomal protein S18 acetylase RimI-like enzyme
MFVPVELAARIEHAEARLSASLGRAVLPSDEEHGPFVEEIAGGVAVYAAPSSPINKMIGVGFAAIPSEGPLQAVEEQYRIRAAPLQAEVSTLADPALAALLTRRGYVLQGFENVLGRAVRPVHDGASADDGGIEIRLTKDGDAARWVDVAIAGFQSLDQQGVQPEPLPPREVLERALLPFAAVRGLLRYEAWVGSDLAGVASLRLDDGVAQLCGAATLPAFRRRGVQTALLGWRLAEAFRAGCELAIMTTQPGSKSQQNGHRQGFALLYSRAVLVKPPAS